MTIWRTEGTSITWCKEAVYGEAPDPNAGALYNRFGLHETMTAADPDVAWQPYWTVGGGRSRSTILRGKWALDGSVPDIRMQAGYARPNSLADLLGLCIGRHDGAGNVYEGQSTYDERLSSFTTQIAMRDTAGSYNFIRSYTGGKVNKATISGKEGEEVRISLDEIVFKDIFLGGSGFAGVNKYASVAYAPDPGPSTKGRFLFAGAQMTMFGVPFCRVRSFSITIDNMLEPRYYFCKANSTDVNPSQVLSDLVEGKRQYEMDLEMDLVDTAGDAALFTYFLNQAGGPVGSSGLTGGMLDLAFAPTEGFSSPSSFHILCTPVPGTAAQPGTMITGAKINMPPPPAAFWQGHYKMNIDRLQFTVPS